MNQLSEAIAQLTEVLDDIESQLERGEVSGAVLEEFKVNVDGIRTTVLAMLTAGDPADYSKVLRSFRTRRATQLCKDILAGIVDGSIGAETEGLGQLYATLNEMMEAADTL